MLITGEERVFSKPKAGLPPVGTPGIHYMRELNLCSQVNPYRERFMVYHSACWLGMNSEMANEWMNCGSNETYASFPAQMPLWTSAWQEWDYEVWNHWCDSRTSWNSPDGSGALQKAANSIPGDGPTIRHQLEIGSGDCADNGMFFN